MNNNEDQGWYTKGAKERVTSKYEINSKNDLSSMNLVDKNTSGKSFGEFTRARKVQMNQARKNKKIDFNANNYDIEELAAILKFESIPLNEGKIKRRILDLRRKFKEPKYQKFFVAAEKRLLDNLDLYNKQTWTEPYDKETSEAAKVLRNQFITQNQEEAREHMNQIINVEKDIIGIPKKPISQTYATKNAVQGKLNGMLITETKRIVNFDSHYRQILDPSSVNCENLDYEANKENRLYTSTNYIVHLNQPLTNVIDLTLSDVEIPNAWYVFSSDYGTNQFKFYFKNKWFIIAIENGNYSQAQLIVEINKKIMTYEELKGHYDSSKEYTTNSSLYDDTNYEPFPLVEFKWEQYTNKVTIYNYDPSGGTMKFSWYDDAPAVVPCAAAQAAEHPRPGGKVDYNLGWLMGFRTKFSNVLPYLYTEDGPVWESNTGTVSGQSQTPPGNGITASYAIKITNGEEEWQGKTRPPSLVDIKGCQYFILTLDDFNNNKPNKDLISLVDQTDRNFKMPSYINSQTMNQNFGIGTYYPGHEGEAGWECRDVADVTNNERACSTNDLNVDLSSNLTRAQLYTANQISMARKQVPVNRFNSPNSTDLLARFSIDRNPLDWNATILYGNPDKELTKRKYFGPVKLSKFKIRLLNDKGFDVNLNDRDWSFSIIVTSLYQY